MARKSSTFFRLEKEIGDGYKRVVEFHTVVNGNIYIAEHEEMPSGRTGYISKDKRCTPTSGNAEYARLKSEGYKFAGVWEMDILGHKTKVEEGK